MSVKYVHAIVIAALMTNACAAGNESTFKVVGAEAQFRITRFRKMMDDVYPRIPVMVEDSEDYEVLVQTRPRPYIVVFFSYNASKESHVQEFEEFQLAANHYYNNKAHYTRKRDGKMYQPIFFAALPYGIPDGNGPGAKKRGLIGHTAVIISTGEENNLESNEEVVRYFRKYLWQIQYSDGIITAARIVAHVGAKTGDIIPYQEPLSKFLNSMGMTLLGLLFCGLVYRYLFWLLTDTRIWILIFFAGYFFSASAYVWMLLNHAPWTGIKDDKPEYIHPSQSHQHRFEGYFMGTLICGIPIASWLFIQVSKRIDNWLLKRLLTYPLAFLACYMFYYLEDVVAMKRWYNPKFLPGKSYPRGTLRQNQGHIL